MTMDGTKPGMRQRKQHRRAYLCRQALSAFCSVFLRSVRIAPMYRRSQQHGEHPDDTSLGVPALMFDASSFNPAALPYLRVAGVSAVRYPGNHGVADLYHWSTKTTTRYKGADAGFFASESNFGNFAQFVDKLGQAVIVVNYGTNLDGTGAASRRKPRVGAYANGDPASNSAIGKDSTGEDWHTVGYWANLRGQAPLASDDGLNFLRIGHPRPFGFRLWQVGDEVYNNGFYGGDHTGTPDLHGPRPPAQKIWASCITIPNFPPPPSPRISRLSRRL